jgi:monoamine oxidase
MKNKIEKLRQKRPGNMQLELESRCVQATPFMQREGASEPIQMNKGVGGQPPEEPIRLTPSAFPDDPFDYEALAKAGLPPTEKPVVVAIVGGGVSGLAAGMELLRAGHIPVIFESSERIGGRLFTVREFEDPHVYAEMGSMRVPPVHRTLMHYLDLFGIKTRKFPNPNNVKTCYYVNGVKAFGTPEKQVDWVQHLYTKWDDAIRPLAKQMEEVWHDPEQRSVRWKEITSRYANHTFRDFLVEEQWTTEEIELFSTVGFGVGGYGPLYPISFIEILRINVCRWDDEQLEILGGNDKLAHGFLNHRVMTEEGEELSLKDLGLVFTRTAVTHISRKDETGQLILTTRKGETFLADAVIITAQARAIQMEMHIRRDLLTPEQWQAIHNTHFMSSGKIFLETDTPFWKENGSEITTTITDLPIRGAYFFDFEETDSGLICASYTWEDDSRKWHASTIEERAEKAIDMLEEIYGKGSIRPHVVSAYGFSWEEMPGYRGAFRQFYAGQQHYYEALAKPSGNIWFAGDAVSYAGGWIEGALQAALRSAGEIATKYR